MAELYRVVCGISEKTGQIYTAIMKAECGLHNNMFSQLQLENPEADDLERIGGSMYLDDQPGGIKLIIDRKVQKQAREEQNLDLEGFLKPSIIKAFQEMKEAGKKFSLREQPKHEDDYAKIEPISAVAARVSKAAQDEIDRKRRLDERRAYEAKNSSVPSWYRFQSRYSGD